MMNTAIGYILWRFFYRITEFLRHWYIRSMRMYWHTIFEMLTEFDRVFALKITLKNIFKPLYGDYTIGGHIIGFIFRLVRIVFASTIYLFIFIIAFAGYIVWFLIPPFLIFQVIRAL